MDLTGIPREFNALYESGETLLQDIDEHLKNWPTEEGRELDHDKLPEQFQDATEQLRDRAHRWFNLLTLHVLPHTTYDRVHVNLFLRRVTAASGGARFYDEYHTSAFRGVLGQEYEERTEHNIVIQVSVQAARKEARAVMQRALRLIRTAPSPLSSPATMLQMPTTSHVSNTAFILMWMDKDRPELVDVHQAVKEVFAEFGVRALRADEVQHQDRITDLILDQIGRSEFLFADVTGERPNVYYEVGYAHALGKRPTLYRRAGTPLHFDLSVHNVPEYENVTQLRNLLRERIAAITGRSLSR